MHSHDACIEQQEFRIVLFLPCLQLFLISNEGIYQRLPRFVIPSRTRWALQLEESLQKCWNTKIFIIDILCGEDANTQCVIVEVRSPDWRFAEYGLTPVPIDAFENTDLSLNEFLTIKKIIAGETEKRGPFSKIGWLEEAQAWIRHAVQDDSLQFDAIQQYTASGHFALIRFTSSSGSEYWLKATGWPNVHECSVTQAIASHCPEFVPPILAVRPEWNAWLSAHAGRPITTLSIPDVCCEVAEGLADLQLTSAAHVENLIIHGCFDLRAPVMLRYMQELIAYLKEAMTRHTSTKVKPISACRLDELCLLLCQALEVVESFHIPNTLIHNDLNPGNILLTGSKPIFIDWAEACIGMPWLTFHHFYVEMLANGVTDVLAVRTKHTYLNHWRSTIGAIESERAFILSKPLAIVSFLQGRDPAFKSPLRRYESTQRHARSLARYIDQIARTQEFQEALCG